jgi:prephenate dehydrogenase
VTRSAGSDTALWTQILAANAAHAAEVLPAIASDLMEAAAALASLAGGDEDAAKRVTGLLERGGAGVARIPGKQGGPAPHYAVVQAVIGDQPGELARLFTAAGEAGINIEDVRIEHSRGRPSGAVALSVRPDAAGPLAAALTAGGWPVRALS